MPTMKNGGSNGMMCDGCQCHGGRGWMFFLLRALITIIILMIVFWFGVAVGSMSGGAWNRYYMMRGDMGGSAGMMQLKGATTTPSMMNGYPQNY